jgi:mono/diheme cytochrome c family protein
MLTRTVFLPFGLVALVPVLAACGQLAAPVPDEGRGAALFDASCSVCHGSSGRGDGELASDLAAPPPDLTGLAARNGGDFPWEAAVAQVHGYPGRHESGLMPEFGSYLTGPETRWTAPDGSRIVAPLPILDIVLYLNRIQG